MSPSEFKFPNLLSEFVYTRTYSRWLSEKGRRETWPETVDRYVDYIFQGRNIPEDLPGKIRSQIFSFGVLPSMRSLWCAGPAMDRDNVCGYNCSFLPLDNLRAFSEALYILMQGTGVGFSVERQFTENLPRIEEPTGLSIDYIVQDSTEGWADAVYFGMVQYHLGNKVNYNYSRVREKGARLKTKGGRASGPEPLKRVLDFAYETISKASGRSLKPIEAHDIMCMIAEIVMVGGFRRASLISFSDSDDLEMRHAKDWSDGKTFPSIRYMSNNSVVHTTRPSESVFWDEWSQLVASGSGERGIYTIHPSKVAERGGDFRSNPCLTGDTLVAVADGRGSVSFKELAEAGSDVPVYCYTDINQVAVRWMRAPRKTGERLPVFKVTLDDGSVVRGTANHRFTLRGGAVKELGQLQPGDRLQVLSRYLTSFAEQIDGPDTSKPKGHDYWWVTGGWKQAKTEHRMVAQFYAGRKLTGAETVHHRDFNPLNNSPSNLEIMLKEDHDHYHSDRMLGDNNPMRRAATEWSPEKWASYRSSMSNRVREGQNGRYCGATNEDLRFAADTLTRSLGRPAGLSDWGSFAAANGYPQAFSAWRKQHLGTIKTFLMASAARCGFHTVTADPRVIRRYQDLLQAGYAVSVMDGRLYFDKECVGCGRGIHTPHRETSQCGLCHAPVRGASKILFRSADAPIKAYNELKFKTGASPSLEAWSSECLSRGVSVDPTLDWDKFRETCADANHIVVSVEPDGHEDVYNGTVDDFHNYFVGGFETITKSGKRKTQYVNTLNCGEIHLRYKRALDPWTGEGGGGSFCNLTAAVMRSEDTLETMAEKIRLAVWLGAVQASYTNFPYLRPVWSEICNEDRLLGVDITGQCDNPALSGDRDFMSYLNAVARETAILAADTLGINRPAAITCGKPSGNSSQFVDCASGFHTRFAQYYFRHVRISAKDPLFHLIRDQGVPVEKENGQEHLPDGQVDVWVARFPVKAPPGCKLREHERALDQCNRYLAIMDTWCGTKGHNQSATIYVRDEEWQEVGQWLWDNFEFVTGLSFLPYSAAKYRLAPYVEISAEEYAKAMSEMPNVDFSVLSFYEVEDQGNGAQEPACMSGSCDL